MDILDIDEALKDDSFIFLEKDKAHDDVSNILQQWKSNNCLSLQTQAAEQEQGYKLNSRTFTRPKRKSAQNLESQFTPVSYQTQQQQQQQLQQQQNQFHLQQQMKNAPMFDLQIGGMVTPMHKSFLQDTSPPSSICSSMDISIERMNNSLITSADFSNINFLQSTHSIDFNDLPNINDRDLNYVIEKSGDDNYTFNDMIRDRKALESLTMSGDGTLIKDSHIGQIDDLSLTFSKTASGCSTMDNSTESVDDNNRTVTIFQKLNREKKDDNGGDGDEDEGEGVSGSGSGSSDSYMGKVSNQNNNAYNAMYRTMLLNNEMLSDMTFNLVENSIYAEDEEQNVENKCASENVKLNVTHDLSTTGTRVEEVANNTFKKPTPMNETVCISAKGSNTTFDCAQSTSTPDGRCETPENSVCIYESTPLTSNVRCSKQQYTPLRHTEVNDANISPIVAAKDIQGGVAQPILNETFNQTPHSKKMKVNTNTFCGKRPAFFGMEGVDSMEMIENIENPHATSNVESNVAALEMQDVLNLAQAEEELLASNDDTEFEHMLEEFSKVELNAEQLKMKQSLETIKKRFANQAEKTEREANKSAGSVCDEEELGAATVEMEKTESPREWVKETSREINEHRKSLLKESLNSSTAAKDLNSSVSANCLTTSSTISSLSSPGERLLSRRSRLYDNINLSTLSLQPTQSPSSLSSRSFTVQKCDGEKLGDGETETENSTNIQKEEQEESNAQKSEDPSNNENSESKAAAYRLAEKRERDRDRFKTIKIVRDRAENCSADGVVGPELEVPCIDDVDDENWTTDKENADKEASRVASADAGVGAVPQRISRRDYYKSQTQESLSLFNNNESEVNANSKTDCNIEMYEPQEGIQEYPENSTNSKINTNYLTYKKPKDVKSNKNLNSQRQQIVPPTIDNLVAPSSSSASSAATVKTVKTRLQPRSLSRPRYISGIQKFNVVKATSASDLGQSKMNSTTEMGTEEMTGLKEKEFSAAVSKQQQQPNSVERGSGRTTDLKSPMGVKSKSFHNLSSNFVYSTASTGMPMPKLTGLKKPNCTATGAATNSKEKEIKSSATQSMATKKNGAMNNSSAPQHQQPSGDGVFKVPKLVSGIRAPNGVKRTGLVRPSSGYYSLNVTAKGMGQTVEQDTDTGRHSPTDSVSSASSRSSIQSGGSGLKAATTTSVSNIRPAALPLALTKITTGSTGIPKPSGLKPPANVKRSGLPKPANFVKR